MKEQGAPMFRDGSHALTVGDHPRTPAWGQLYEAIDGNPSTNTRVELKDLETWVLSTSNVWTRVQYSQDVGGAHYIEDFATDASQTAESLFVQEAQPSG